MGCPVIIDTATGSTMEIVDLTVPGLGDAIAMYALLKKKQYDMARPGGGGRQTENGIPIKVTINTDNIFCLILALLSMDMDWMVECEVCPDVRPTPLWVHLNDSFRNDVSNIHKIITTGPDRTTVSQLRALCALYQERGVFSWTCKKKEHTAISAQALPRV